METIKINLNNFFKKDIDIISDYLLKGKVVVLPTDTIYGLHCLATDAKAVNKIYKIKKRDKTSPVSIIVKSYCMLHNYAFVSTKQDKYIRSIWPKTTRDAQNSEYKHKNKPTTFILRDRCKLPKQVTVNTESLAVRLPKDDFLITILKRVNMPLISTSLNISGRKNINNLNNLNRYFKINKPDLVVDAGLLKQKKASSIIDIRDINNIKILRK